LPEPTLPTFLAMKEPSSNVPAAFIFLVFLASARTFFLDCSATALRSAARYAGLMLPFSRKTGMPYLDFPVTFSKADRKDPKPLDCFWMFLVAG